MSEPKEVAQASTTAVDSSPDPSITKEEASTDARSIAEDDGRIPPPLWAKLVAVLLISLIGFGGHWSSGITSAMKSTLKKKLSITNTQYSLLDGSDDFMATVLILFTGYVTDRFGGARLIVYGNIIYTIGSILIAASTNVRSYKFMIFGHIVLSLGDIATQIAQYKMFSSWFPPSSGFASTLGFELGIGKIGSFVGSTTANVISKNTGDFSWTFWVAAFINIFTNLCTLAFWWFTRYCKNRYSSIEDPATNEKLTEKNKKFEWKKIFDMPWTFWCVLAFSLFQTSTAVVFSQNATELAERRFNVDAITAGWYSSMAQYLGFFLVPILGAFIDLAGNRLTVMFVCGAGMFIAMALVNWSTTAAGTGAAFGVYAVALSLGPTTIIDSIRTSMLKQGSFGTAYSIKIQMNNAMNIIVRIIAAALQDADDDSYRRATRLYVFDAAMAVVVGSLLMLGWLFVRGVDLKMLQFTRKQRLARGDEIKLRREDGLAARSKAWDRTASLIGCIFIGLLTLGGWTAYFWGVATGHND